MDPWARGEGTPQVSARKRRPPRIVIGGKKIARRKDVIGKRGEVTRPILEGGANKGGPS